MRLYIMRHGEAVEVGQREIERDDDRMLTGEGRRQARRMADFMRQRGCRPETVLTSPLARAWETARIAATRLGRPAVETSGRLAPGHDPAATAGWLGRRQEQSLLLVGHMPDLAALVSRLVAGTAGAGLDFKKGGLACVGFDGPAASGRGVLEWLVQPALLKP